MLKPTCVAAKLCRFMGSEKQASTWSDTTFRSMLFQPCLNPFSLALRIPLLPRFMWCGSSPKLPAWFSGWGSQLAHLHRPGTR